MLRDLQLKNFRCFNELAVKLGANFNVFLGENAQGKTSILEAACVLLRLQSQRASSFAPIVQSGKKSFSIRAEFENHALEFHYEPPQRVVKFDRVEQRTFGEYLRLGRVVSFANSDIELARGSSESRRRYLDFLGSQIEPAYRPVLRNYERTLRARNAILKSPIPRSRELAAYDGLFVEHGTRLFQLRAKLVERIGPFAATAYERISGGKERLGVFFLPGSSADLAEDLRRSQAEASRLKQTVIGPHRDDLCLTIDEMPAAQFASEGQQRSVALALKVAQANAFQNAADGKPPLLLIDDIFGELDAHRRNALLDNLPAPSQKMITATAMPWRNDLKADTIYELRDRQLILK